MEKKDKFTFGQHLLYGTPYLLKDIEGITWQQRERMIEGIQKSSAGFVEKGDKIIQAVRDGQYSQQRSGEEFKMALKDSIGNLMEQQAAQTEQLLRQQTYSSEQIVDKIDETARMGIRASAHFTGNVLGGRPEEPRQLHELGLKKEEAAALVASGARSNSEVRDIFTPIELAVLRGEISTYDKPEIEGQLRQIDEVEPSLVEQYKRDLSGYEKLIADYNTEPAADKKNALYLSKSELDKSLYEQREQINLLQRRREELRQMSGALQEFSTLVEQTRQKDLPSLVREGYITPKSAEILVRKQALTAPDTDDLYEARIVKGPLGSLKRMNILGEDMREMAARQEKMTALTCLQNERRDSILTHVKNNLGNIGMELSTQTGILQDQNLILEDQNLILENFASDMVEGFGLVHCDLEQIDETLRAMGETLENYLMRACLDLEDIKRELVLTRLFTLQRIDRLTNVVAEGLGALQVELRNIQDILMKIWGSLATPRKTAATEALDDALISIEKNDIEGAISILEETKPESHRMAGIHLMLGSCYYYSKQPEKAIFPLTKAIQHGDPSIQEQASMILAHLVLEAGDESLARGVLEKIVTDDQINKMLNKSLVQYGKYLHAAEDYQRSLHYFLVALTRDPNNVCEIMKFWETEKGEVLQPELEKKFGEIIGYNFSATTFYALSILVWSQRRSDSSKTFLTRALEVRDPLSSHSKKAVFEEIKQAIPDVDESLIREVLRQTN